MVVVVADINPHSPYEELLLKNDCGGKSVSVGVLMWVKKGVEEKRQSIVVSETHATKPIHSFPRGDAASNVQMFSHAGQG